MAETVWYWRPGNAGHQGDGTFESDDFNDAADGSGNWGQPDGVDDSAVFDDHADCTACAVDVGTLPLAGLTMTGYADTMTLSNDAVVDVQGNAILDGTTAGVGLIWATGSIEFTAGMTHETNVIVRQIGTSGTPTITFNSVTGIDLEIDNAGVTSCIAQDAVDLHDFVMYAGKYSDGGFAHSISNQCLPGAGDWTTNGAWDINANLTLTGLATWAGAGNLNVSGDIILDSGTTYSHTGIIEYDGAGTAALDTGGHDIKLNCSGAGDFDDITLGDSQITLTGTLDGGGGGTVTATMGMRFLPGTPTPTIQNLDASGTAAILAIGCIDGGGNVNVLFDLPGGGMLEIGKPGVRVP